MPTFLAFGGGTWPGCPLDPPVQPVGTNQTNQATSNVPKFVDLCGRRHPLVNNFPLSHVIFKVNFPLPNDPLALVSAKRQQQHFNESFSQVKDLELSGQWNHRFTIILRLGCHRLVTSYCLRWYYSLTMVGSRQAAKWSEMKLMDKVVSCLHFNIVLPYDLSPLWFWYCSFSWEKYGKH